MKPLAHGVPTGQISACDLLPSAPPVKVQIGNRWMDYHGLNDWDGLLDPLDDTLRSELLRYGKFVQATYSCFDFDPGSPSYTSSRFPKHSLLPLCGLHDSGYRVTRDLYASSGIRLPRWAETVLPFPYKTSWIGYIAVCDDEEEIARLGRRDVVVALRGTVTCAEWLENVCGARLTGIPCGRSEVEEEEEEEDIRVETGFWNLYTSAGLTCRSLQEQVRHQIQRLIGLYRYDKTPMSVTITGHSLGAALAVITAYDITTSLRRHRPPHVAVVSFGGPRVGNASFRREVEQLGIKVLRIVNTGDIVTKVPGFPTNGDDVGKEDGELPGWLSKAKWAYCDVGQELRVSCASSNMAVCHDLNVYLQLLKQLRVR